MALDTEEHLIALLDRAGFAVEEDAPWFTHHFLDLAAVPELHVTGYSLRHVEPGEAAARAACHRDAWSATSKVSTGAYERLMRTRPTATTSTGSRWTATAGWSRRCACGWTPTPG